MLNRIVYFLLLLATWLIMSGLFKPFLITVGILSCFAALILYIKLDDTEGQDGGAFIFFRMISYSFWLIKEIVLSSWDVTVRMWRLEPDISPTIGWINTPLKSDVGLTIFGNSITLTPGTVTVEVKEDGMVQVHAITKEGMEGLKSGDMLKRVVNVVGR